MPELALLHLLMEKMNQTRNQQGHINSNMPLSRAAGLLLLKAFEETIEACWPACNWTLTTSSGLPTQMPTTPLM
jgi:hypothetical protein